MAKNTRLVGAAALTMVRPEGSAAPSIYVYAGEPEPAGADKDDVKRLVKEGYLEEQEVAAAASDDGDEGPTKVDDILAEVGEDKAKAQQYLDQEQAAEKPRSSLVSKLQAVIDA